MTDSAATAFKDRLHRVAVAFILPTGLRVDMAVTLAEDLVASGVGEAATIAVAALARDSLVSDAERPVREMLAEHGIDVPQTHDEQVEYQVLLRAFGYWDLPIHNFEGPFYGQIAAWDDQGSLDRALVTMLDRRDHETTPQARAAVERAMRDTVRRHVAPR
ncbi:hypothetical protein GCM10023350_19690 [Nocardioides endophyticus]|uniref:Uncharacterized protein n=1 Tax=Nocardioides endophyticus TaxID=1353775 RepID=A0ABP8YRZ1_9ACTN